jgi:hypothetical protein
MKLDQRSRRSQVCRRCLSCIVQALVAEVDLQVNGGQASEAVGVEA